MKNKKQYEYKVFSAHENYIGQNMEKALADGWIEAGPASVQYHGAPTNAAFIYIPMKREKVIIGNYLEESVKKQMEEFIKRLRKIIELDDRN